MDLDEFEGRENENLEEEGDDKKIICYAQSEAVRRSIDKGDLIFVEGMRRRVQKVVGIVLETVRQDVFENIHIKEQFLCPVKPVEKVSRKC